MRLRVRFGVKNFASIPWRIIVSNIFVTELPLHTLHPSYRKSMFHAKKKTNVKEAAKKSIKRFSCYHLENRDKNGILLLKHFRRNARQALPQSKLLYGSALEQWKVGCTYALSILKPIG